MTSFNTIFKRVYEERLAPYGYKKLKGRRPYFVRVIEGEVVHVITYINEWMNVQGYKAPKAFSTMGGIATVYRSNLNFEITPKENKNWFVSNFDIYVRKDPVGYDRDIAKGFSKFVYEPDNERSMKESVERSFDVTEQVMLPIFSQVTDLTACWNYFPVFWPGILWLPEEPKPGERWSHPDGEGLLNFKVVDSQQYAERERHDLEKYFTERLKLIEQGSVDLTMEGFEREKKIFRKNMERQIATFEKLITDPEKYERVQKELEQRRKRNQDMLRAYGFDV